MSDVQKFKDDLVFDIQKAFYDERGRGARYRLTLLGVEYLKNELGEDDLDIDTVKEWLVDNELVEEIDHEEDNISFTAEVKNCCLLDTREKFEKNDMEVLSCPIANMLMYLNEIKTGFSPELLPVKTDGVNCKFTFAKMATSDVVDEV